MNNPAERPEVQAPKACGTPDHTALFSHPEIELPYGLVDFLDELRLRKVDVPPAA